jgi:hypothetical protein
MAVTAYVGVQTNAPRLGLKRGESMGKRDEQYCTLPDSEGPIAGLRNGIQIAQSSSRDFAEYHCIFSSH